MKMQGERGRLALFIGCVYMPTDSTSVAVLDTCFERGLRKSARWWDNETKDKISCRCEVYKKVVSGRKELWDEYCRLCKEVKEAVREKKPSIWNEVVEKVNADMRGVGRSFGLLSGGEQKVSTRILLH